MVETSSENDERHEWVSASEEMMTMLSHWIMLFLHETSNLLVIVVVVPVPSLAV